MEIIVFLALSELESEVAMALGGIDAVGFCCTWLLVLPLLDDEGP